MPASPKPPTSPATAPPPTAASSSTGAAAEAAAAGEESTYTFAAASQILDIPETKLRYWSQVGFVGPSIRRSGKQLFTFQDLVGVKAAKELTDRGVRPGQIRKALAAVRTTLPHVDRPLERIRLAFDGETLVIVDEGGAFEPSGQRTFDFGIGDLARRSAEIRSIPFAEGTSDSTVSTPSGLTSGSDAATTPAVEATAEADTRAGMSEGAAGATGSEGTAVQVPPLARTAYDWFLEGTRLESEGASAAQITRCYREAIALDPGLAAAHTNLGNLAHRQGNAITARQCFETALGIDPEQPEARFNLANLLLEEGDLELAVAELRRVLQSAPDFPDAHFNLAIALSRLGGRTQARAHLEQYLTLQQQAGALYEADSEDEANTSAAPGDPWAEAARTLMAQLGGAT